MKFKDGSRLLVAKAGDADPIQVRWIGRDADESDGSNRMTITGYISRAELLDVRDEITAVLNGDSAALDRLDGRGPAMVDRSAWLIAAQTKMSIGRRVCVVASDIDDYIGLCGVVRGYDLGDADTWPLVSVTFDAPIGDNQVAHDGFYWLDGADDNEIVRED